MRKSTSALALISGIVGSVVDGGMPGHEALTEGLREVEGASSNAGLPWLELIGGRVSVGLISKRGDVIGRISEVGRFEKNARRLRLNRVREGVLRGVMSERGDVNEGFAEVGRVVPDAWESCVGRRVLN
jgi:hypothetical protein